MNYKTNLNYTAWLFALVITIAFVGLSSVQAQDGERPHEDEEPPTEPAPPNNPDDANNPEDYWGPPEGSSATAEANIPQPSTTIKSSDVPPACQSHYENYQSATGQHILVTLSALDKCIREDTHRRIREFLANTPCEDIREEYDELSHWDLFVADAAAGFIGGLICSRGGFLPGSGCAILAGAAVHACLNG